MKYIISVFIIILAFAFVFAGNAELGQQAPDFTLVDSNGKKHSLSDFKGKYVVLEWVNFGCPFVKKHYNSKNMQSLQKTYTGKDVIWLSICSSASGKQGHFSAKEINEQLKSKGGSATAYLIDEDGKVGKMYGAETTPHMYIIDPDGMLVYNGAIDDVRSTNVEDVDKAKNYIVTTLDALMAGKELKPYKTVPYGCSVKYQ